jgi:hypothetical protein
MAIHTCLVTYIYLVTYICPTKFKLCPTKIKSDRTNVLSSQIFICSPVPWFQRFIFIIFIAKGRGKINLWLKAAIDSSSRANQFEFK